MNCKQCQQTFTEYCSRSLQPPELSQVRDHLSQCPLCQQALQETQTLFSLLDRPETLSEQAQQRLLGNLQLSTGQAGASGSLPGFFLQQFQRLWPSRPLWAAAYSCALLLTGVISGRLLPDAAKVMQADDGASTALICPVMSPAAQWLPVSTENTLT